MRIFFIGLFFFMHQFSSAFFLKDCVYPIGMDRNYGRLMTDLSQSIASEPDRISRYISFSGILIISEIGSPESVLENYFNKDSFAYHFILMNYYRIRNKPVMVEQHLEQLHSFPQSLLIYKNILSVEPAFLSRILESDFKYSNEVAEFLKWVYLDNRLFLSQEDLMYLSDICSKAKSTDDYVFFSLEYIKSMSYVDKNAMRYVIQNALKNEKIPLEYVSEYLVGLNIAQIANNEKYNGILSLFRGNCLNRSFMDFRLEDDYSFLFLTAFAEMNEYQWLTDVFQKRVSLYEKYSIEQNVFFIYKETALYSYKNGNKDAAFRFFEKALAYIEYGDLRGRLETIKGVCELSPPSSNHDKYLRLFKGVLDSAEDSMMKAYFMMCYGEINESIGNQTEAAFAFAESYDVFRRIYNNLSEMRGLYNRLFLENLFNVAVKSGNKERVFQDAMVIYNADILRPYQKMLYERQLYILLNEGAENIFEKWVVLPFKSFKYIKNADDTGKEEVKNTQGATSYYYREKASFLKEYEKVQRDYSAAVRLLIIIGVGVLLIVVSFGFLFWLLLYYISGRTKNRLGHYRLREVLGEGATAFVYKASSLKDPDSDFALKILKEQFGKEDDFYFRFKREAEMMMKLSHPNILRIMDLGEYREKRYIATELVNGLTLDDIVNNRWPLDSEVLCNYLNQIMDGLSYLHSKGIVHRDLKPSNIMVHFSGENNLELIKIMDLGLALDTQRTRLTTTEAILGTPAYISPEMFYTGITDERTDIYSLGMVMYELYTGTLPFAHPNAEVVINQVLMSEPQKPSEVYSDITPETEWIIMKCLEKMPDDRYQSIEELKRDFLSIS